jgi:hypothetical protein
LAIAQNLKNPASSKENVKAQQNIKITAEKKLPVHTVL